MKPVYFPFTTVDENQAALLLTCFGTVDLYLPTSSAAAGIKEKGLNPIVPLPEDPVQVEDVYRACRQWGDATAGAAAAYFKNGRAPFFDENTISFIRQQIVEKSAGKDDPSGPDPLLQARVFLRLTADYDGQQMMIGRFLNEVENRRKALFETLRGGEETGLSGKRFAGAGEDPGRHLTRARLEAWSKLVLAGGGVPDLYVTASPAVFDTIDDTFSAAEIIVYRRAVAAPRPADDSPAARNWRDELFGFWNACLRVNGDSPPDESISPVEFEGEGRLGMLLDVMVLPGLSPADFLAVTAGGTPAVTPTAGAAAVVVCLRPL